jgi:hypothetical protein
MTLKPRAVAAAVVVLAVEAALALLGVWIHFGFTSVYGNINDTALEALGWGLTSGVSGVVLAGVAVVALIAVVFSPRAWMRLTAVALPILMLLGMLALTPSALRHKTEMRNCTAPQCVGDGSGEPAATVERKSQRAFESIEHIGYFDGVPEAGW